jgi:uncharacterized protein (DUF433 family)
VSDLGLGMYTLADASKLLGGVEVRSLSRWLYGYSYPDKNAAGASHRRYSEPLWSPQYDPAAYGEKVIGFHDLLEARIVREFVRAGLHLIIIRKCLERARQVFGAQYPLSTQRFVTDGETILHEARQAANEEDDGRLLDLRTMQYKFKAIIKPSLYAGVEYMGLEARRWYPEGPRASIVVDPALNFGHPVLRGTGIPTEALYASFLAEGKDRGRVARLYEVSPQDVTAAVKFEGRLRQAA